MNLDGTLYPLFIGFYSGAPGKEVSDRIGEYIESCGKRAIAMEGTGTSLPPSVIIITMHADESIPDEINQTVYADKKSCRIAARIVRLATMSIDDLVAKGFHMLLPFWVSAKNDLFSGMGTEPKKRREVFDDMKRVVDILQGPLPYPDQRPLLLRTAKELFLEKTSDYPEMQEEIKRLFKKA